MKRAAILLGFILSLCISGTAFAGMSFNLDNPAQRAALVDLIKEKTGVTVPAESLPTFPVILTLAQDMSGEGALKATIEAVGEVKPADESVEKLAKLVKNLVPSVQVTVKVPKASELTSHVVKGEAKPIKGELEKKEVAVKAPELSKKAQKKAEKVTGLENALIHSHHNTPKEVGHAGILQARDGRPGKEVVHDSHETRSTPSVENELGRRRAVQAMGLHVGNHGMVAEVNNPLSALGGKVLRGRQ